MKHLRVWTSSQAITGPSWLGTGPQILHWASLSCNLVIAVKVEVCIHQTPKFTFLQLKFLNQTSFMRHKDKTLILFFIGKMEYSHKEKSRVEREEQNQDKKWDHLSLNITINISYQWSSIYYVPAIVLTTLHIVSCRNPKQTNRQLLLSVPSWQLRNWCMERISSCSHHHLASER